jgi:molybdopterin molybdotransferase
MISEEDTLAAILKKVRPLPSCSTPLFGALDRFSARDIFARLPLPAFDNSAMDGYAVMAELAAPGRRLRVNSEQAAAGENRNLALKPGEAIRIFTGAPIPAGADAVIMQEDVERVGDEIIPRGNAEPGEFIRRKGSDLAEGQKIVSLGERIRPQTLGVLASQGLAEIEVGGLPRVAIISTGNELVPLSGTPRRGQIYESNSIMLQALTTKAGAEVVVVEHCADDPEALQRTRQRGMQNDVLIVSGGMSVGDHDFVKPGLSSLGAAIDLWRVAIKPGNRFCLGALKLLDFRSAGNPVSAFVTFLKFVGPALLKMMFAGGDELSCRK